MMRMMNAVAVKVMATQGIPLNAIRIRVPFTSPMEEFINYSFNFSIQKKCFSQQKSD